MFAPFYLLSCLFLARAILHKRKVSGKYFFHPEMR